jgi:ribosome recycling factor
MLPSFDGFAPRFGMSRIACSMAFSADLSYGVTTRAAKDDFATVRTGRANPQLFQKILVDYYGSPTPLAQLAFAASTARSMRAVVSARISAITVTPFVVASGESLPSARDARTPSCSRRSWSTTTARRRRSRSWPR